MTLNELISKPLNFNSTALQGVKFRICQTPESKAEALSSLEIYEGYDLYSQIIKESSIAVIDELEVKAEYRKQNEGSSALVEILKYSNAPVFIECFPLEGSTQEQLEGFYRDHGFIDIQESRFFDENAHQDDNDDMPPQIMVFDCLK